MKKQWLLFAREHNGAHYWYDGGVPLNLDHPTENLFWDESMLQQLERVAKSNRIKLFVYNKTRYVIVARGTRYEP